MRRTLTNHVLTRTTIAAASAALGLSALAAPPAAAEPDGPSSAELAAVSEAVDATRVDGIAWHTDEQSGTVVVRTDSTVTDAEREQLRGTAGGDPSAVTIVPTDGRFRPLLGSGDPIYGPDYRCSVGFNVRKGDEHFLLTAGHCGENVDTWYADESGSVLVGDTVGASYPGNDFAVVRYDTDDLRRPGGYHAGKARVGQEVARHGSTSDTEIGEVTALGVTVKYEGGVAMHGMIEADVCSRAGDSGGALYSGSTALGIVSGGSGSCAPGAVSFHQPVGEALRAFDVELY